MHISFVIPAYNCQATITETVESIFDGNFTEGDEVIIVDDASSDQTPAVIGALATKYAAIRPLKHTINKGSAAAGRNTAIDQAVHELIFCLDADNILVPGSIEQLKQYLLDTQADVAAFGEIHFFKDRNPERIKKELYKTIFSPGVFTLADALRLNYWCGHSGNYLYKKETWKQAGRYNESIGGAYDSWAFGFCQLAKGCKLVKLENSYYLHRAGYESTFVKENRRLKGSLVALQVMMPFLDQIIEEDVEYIFGKDTRYTWFDDLEKRPIQLRSGETGSGGLRVVQVNAHVKKLPVWKRIAAAVIREIRNP